MNESQAQRRWQAGTGINICMVARRWGWGGHMDDSDCDQATECV